MNGIIDKVKRLSGREFTRQLFKGTAMPLFIILGVGFLYVLSMVFIDHQALPFPQIILSLAIAKTIFISHSAMKRLTGLVRHCGSANRLLLVFGILIGAGIVSFAADYTCLYQVDSGSFSGMNSHPGPYLHDLGQFMYFSLITFATIGFGDIVPVTGVARAVVMLEVGLSFFIVVFAVSNIKQINQT